MSKHATLAVRFLIATVVLGGAIDICTGVSPPCFAQTKRDLSRPLFPKVESREGDLHILEPPPGAQRIDLKELQKQSSEMLHEFIQPGMTLRIAFRVDLTNNGEDDVRTTSGRKRLRLLNDPRALCWSIWMSAHETLEKYRFSETTTPTLILGLAPESM